MPKPYRRITKERRKAGDRLRRQVERAYSASASGRGQPSKYRPGFCELATRHCMLGATNEELGELFGVTKETVQDWMRTKPEFKAAVYEGREGADAKVAAALHHRAIGYSHPEEVIHFDKDGNVHRAKTRKQYPPSETAAKFLLTNRRSRVNHNQAEEGNTWADKIEASGPGGGPLDVTVAFVKATATKGKA